MARALKDIVLIGGGGHCRVLIDACRACGYRPVGVLDPNLVVGGFIMGVEVLGGERLASGIENAHFECQYAAVAVAGNLQLRYKLVQEAELAGFLLPMIANNPLYVSSSSVIGEGVAILPGCIVNAEAVIGRHVTLNTSCVVEHGARVGEYSHIAPNATLLGESAVGDFCTIGSGSVVLPGVSIGNRCTVGAGSVVLRDVQDGCTVVGNPARVIRGSL